MTAHRKGMLLTLTMGVSALPVGSVAVQDARWVLRSEQATGPNEAQACSMARNRASKMARGALGLNIKDCVCKRIAGKVQGQLDTASCRLTYELLVRPSSR